MTGAISPRYVGSGCVINDANSQPVGLAPTLTPTYLETFHKAWECLCHTGTTTRNDLAHALGLLYKGNMTNAEVAEALLDALTIEHEILTHLKRLRDPQVLAARC